MNQYVEDLLIEDYHANFEYIGKSMLSVYADCPAKYKWMFVDGNYTPSDTKANDIGQCTHTAILECRNSKSAFI